MYLIACIYQHFAQLRCPKNPPLTVIGKILVGLTFFNVFSPIYAMIFVMFVLCFSIFYFITILWFVSKSLFLNDPADNYQVGLD